MPSMTSERKPAFLPGTVAITPGAEDLLKQEGMHPLQILQRHVCGDWDQMDAHDRESNWRAAGKRGYVLSSFCLPATSKTIWIITEPGHTMTTILLPSEH